MLNFQIQSDSEIPASKQLFDQIQFAIASGQYPPDHRLPSTRQLAMITGLHRNTISKVYQNLEETGLVESVAGSGIYVKNQARKITDAENSSADNYSLIVQTSIDSLLEQGLNLAQIRDFFLEEIDWRIQCNQQVIITVPQQSLNEGKVMELELSEALEIPIQLIPLEDLEKLLAQKNFGTLITNRYFLKEVIDVVPPNSFRVIPVDIYDYSKELAMIKKLPKQACLGIISLSESILAIASSIVNSQRGDDILVLTASPGEPKKLMTVVRTAHTIIVGPSSYNLVQEAIAKSKRDLIRIPDLIRSNNFINEKSVEILKQQLQ
jgi:GntR family transcriptional regulator